MLRKTAILLRKTNEEFHAPIPHMKEKNLAGYGEDQGRNVRHRGRKLHPSIKRGSKSKEEEIDLRIDRMLNPHKYEDGIIPSWDTVGKEDDKPYSLEDLVNIKPFKMEDLNTLIAFRAPDKVLRATQRIKERSGGTYDIMSDLHRDIYMLGLIVMTERYEDILGGEIIIERAKSRARRKKDIEDQVRRLSEQLIAESDTDRNIDYSAFMESVKKSTLKDQELYVRAMETNPLLVELRRRMVEIAMREEAMHEGSEDE